MMLRFDRVLLQRHKPTRDRAAESLISQIWRTNKEEYEVSESSGSHKLYDNLLACSYNVSLRIYFNCKKPPASRIFIW